MYNVPRRRWVRFNQVPLGEGYRRFRVDLRQRPAGAAAAGSAPGRGGRAAGRPGRRCRRPTGRAAGRSRSTRRRSGRSAPTATGTHDVFLVFRSADDKPVGEFEYFRFEQYRGQIPLQKNEVKLELRVGSKDGEKIGEFYPRCTGGRRHFRELVATLEPAQGTQPLFLVVRSALAGADRQHRRAQPGEGEAADRLDRVGVPPLMVKGKPVLPGSHEPPLSRDRPTSSPRPRDSAAVSGRPIATACAVAKAPVIDGKLDEWPTDRRQAAR